MAPAFSALLARNGACGRAAAWLVLAACGAGGFRPAAAGTDAGDGPGAAEAEAEAEAESESEAESEAGGEGESEAESEGESEAESEAEGESEPPAPPACSDGLDNDGDGRADGDDPGCEDASDGDEADEGGACRDGVDNDRDGWIDYAPGAGGDPGCLSPDDPGEREEGLPCDDGVDDDGDGVADFALDLRGDPDCLWVHDPVEGPDQTDTFFDHGNVAEIDLVLHDDDWEERLLADNFTELPADFHYRAPGDEETVSDVGVRFAGLKSLEWGLESGKYPWKVRFSEFVDGQRFRGLKSLRIKNLYDDTKAMEEALSYTMMRASGVPSSRWRYAWVRAGAAADAAPRDFGLYLAVEPVDKRYLAARFADHEGNLYRCDWEWDVDDRPCSPRTNESTPEALYTDLIEVAELLEDTDDADLEDAIVPRVDLGEYFRAFAVSNALADSDGINASWGGSFDYYLYHDPTSGRLFTINWDPDRSWHRIDWCPYWFWDEIAITRRFGELPRWRDRYHALLREAADRIDAGLIAATRDALWGLIEPRLVADIALGLNEFDMDDYDTGRDRLADFLAERPAVARDLAGSPWDEARQCCWDPADGRYEHHMQDECVP